MSTDCTTCRCRPNPGERYEDTACASCPLAGGDAPESWRETTRAPRWWAENHQRIARENARELMHGRSSL